MRSIFDEMTNRRGTFCMKWDGEGDADGVLPLWVADMDFRTAPSVTEAVVRRASSGIFGYTSVPDIYYDAVCNWFYSHHGWKIDRKRIIYTSGVVPALSAIIKALTKPGDGVILQIPAYNCFFSSIRNNGCRIIENKLLRKDTATGFSYEIDFDSLEREAAKAENKLLILCNPHNPTGRVWSPGELTRIYDICRRNDVRVVSDEIHCELVYRVSNGYGYTPYATIDKQAVVCCSPSKAFNIAGLQIANIVCPDEQTQSLIDRAINDNEVCDVNPFGVDGLIAAYNKGGFWLDSLVDYLNGNYRYLRARFEELFPEIRVCDSESTYLAWVDISATGMDSKTLAERILKKGKVRISAGDIYGDDNYIRINYACPRERLAAALDRIIPVIRRCIR